LFEKLLRLRGIVPHGLLIATSVNRYRPLEHRLVKYPQDIALGVELDHIAGTPPAN